MQNTIGAAIAATAPAAGNGIAGVWPADFVPMVTVTSLATTDGSMPSARISIDDSPDGTTWTPYCEFHFQGHIVSPITQSQRAPSAVTLQSNVRANLLSINGTISYTASI